MLGKDGSTSEADGDYGSKDEIPKDGPVKKKFKETFGTNPKDPWSAKAEIAEDDEKSLVARFLKSKGIDPRYINHEKRAAHGRSGEFQAWKARMKNLPVPQNENTMTPDQLAAHHGVSVDKIRQQLNIGQKIEHEHTSVDSKALKIAKDHVKEFPDYYTRLNKLEKGANAALPPNDPEKKVSESTLSRVKKYLKKIDEELYDHEKDDKTSDVKGTAPKLEKAEDQSRRGEAPTAKAVLSGGKTETGKPRDTIEIDPALRNRPMPGQADLTKANDVKK